MRYQVTKRMLRGQPIDLTEVRALQPLVGDVQITDQRCEQLGRNSKTATVRGVNPIGLSSLPPLHEVVLSWMAPNGLVLSGLEVEDGRLYAQSWWCRPAD